MDDVFVVELELGEDRDEDVARAEERERAEVRSGGVLTGGGAGVVNVALHYACDMGFTAYQADCARLPVEDDQLVREIF